MQTKRFILLVDELYERDTSLHCLAAASTPDQLFAAFLDPVAALPDSVPSAPQDAPQVRAVDESQLAMSVVDAGIINLRVACARAASRLVEVCAVTLSSFT
jgi:predicted ATPase